MSDDAPAPAPADLPKWFVNNAEFSGARIVASTDEPGGYVSHFVRFEHGSAVVIDHPPTERWIVAGVFPGPRAAPGDIGRVKRRGIQQLARDAAKR